MTTVPDAEARQLLAAALEADRAGDADRSLELLLASAQASQFNPDAHHLLGAEYAQRGDQARAVLHLTTAVEQAPARAEARLQLGLLWLVIGNRNTAAQVLEPLTRLPDTEAMRHYATALHQLCMDQAGPAAAALELGLSIGSANAALQDDMRGLLARIRRAEAGAMDEADRVALQQGLAISAYAGGRLS